MLPDNDGLIQQFIDMLWLEYGLSENTRQAYSSDLRQLAIWLSAELGVSLLSAEAENLERFIQWRSQKGDSARSTRRALSAWKRFYRYLIVEELRQDNPSSLIESPSIGRPLPATLSEVEVEQLLAAPDVNTPIGLRDRAMLRFYMRQVYA